MKLIVTITCSTLLIGFTYGQTLKTYTGSYAGGIATYQYYENTNYERIFNGKFSYKSVKDNVNLYRVHIPSSIEINGTFKNNFKNGLWMAKDEMSTDVPNYGNIKITTTVNGPYLNGKRQDQWRYNIVLLSTKKNVTENYLVNFNNNILIGAVNLSNTKGNLDNQGNFIGTWNIQDKNEGTEYIAEFKKNVFIKLIKRKVATGEILFRNGNNYITTLFFDSLKTNQNLVIQNGKRYISIDCDKLENDNNQNIEYNKDNEFFGEFYKVFSKQIRAFDKSLETINLGSTEYLITIPKVIVEFHGSTKEEKDQEEEKVFEDEKILKQKEQEEAKIQKLQEEKRTEEKRQNDIELAKIREFERTDYGRLQEGVRKEFNIWLVKSDFETNSDFETRIKNQSDEKFKSLLSKNINSSMRGILNNGYATIGKYNPDNETFPIFFRRDTAFIKIHKDIASSFYASFSEPKLGEDNPPIYVIPMDIKMINNLSSG